MGSLLACLLIAAWPQAGTDAFDELLLRYANAGWSGAALVARGGEALLAKGYGFADFESNRPNDADTLFEIASITKPFTALALVQLAQQGKLALDDALAVHLPGVPQHSRAITLRQLLSHTSGIPGRNAKGTGEDLALAMLAYLGDGPHEEPGSTFEYWNGGYALLAGVIERVSGRAYPQFVRESILTPAGMSSSGFTGDAACADRSALGTPSKGRARYAYEHPYGSYGYQYRGMGGLVTSVRDLLAFERALSTGTLLDDAHVRELFTPVAKGYALGWFVGRAADGGRRQWHGGAVRGFQSELRRFPDAKACLAVLSNDETVGPIEIAENLECLLLGRALAAPAPQGVTLTAAQREACAGTYVGAAGRLVVQAAEGVLVAGLEGEGLLAKLGADEELAWEADRALLARRAVEVVEGIAHGDTSPLRNCMAKRIPKDWPDRVRTQTWPAHLGLHGEFRGARPAGVVARDGRVEVLVALEHERGPARALIAFGPAGLERLDWQGPRFLAHARLEPLRKDAFRLLLGKTPKLEFELEGGHARSVRVGGVELERH